MIWSGLARAGARTALVAVLGTATVAAWQARPPAPGGARISGTVKNAADDAPLSRARVVAQTTPASDPHVALTGADGKYVIADLPPGSYTISVTRSGYAAQTYGSARQPDGLPVPIAAGQTATTIDFALVSARAITGRILDEDGTPFAGAIVRALVSRSQAGSDTLIELAAAATDDRGEFRLHGLAPGQYYVSASDPAFERVASSRGVRRYSSTYHPGVPFADQAKPVTVSGTGPEPRVEFKLQLIPPARVAGRLVAEDGKPLLNGAIIMSPSEGEGVPMVPPDDPSVLPDGTFSFGHVVPGRYDIRARGQTTPEGSALFGVFSLEVLGADVEGIFMTLRQGALLDGTIAVDARRGTKPPQFATLRVRAPFIDGHTFGDALTGIVRPDSQFTLRGLMRGQHQLVIDGLPEPWAVKSVHYRGRDITDQEIQITGKEQMRDVRITITDVSATVSGVVTNPKETPLANAGVLVFPKAAIFWTRTSRRMRAAYTDQAGRFRISGLPPGDYLAVAAPSVDESDLGRRSRLQALQEIAVPFSLDSDDAGASITLQMFTGAGTR